MNKNLYGIAALAGLSAMTVIPAQIAYAQQQTTTLVMVKGVGLDGNYYKAVVEDDRGKRFFVWYSDLLEASNGSTVLLEYQDFYAGDRQYWKTLTNPRSGKVATVSSYQPIKY
jgi:hypothetical protein